MSASNVLYDFYLAPEKQITGILQRYCELDCRPHNEVDITVKWAIQIFWYPKTYKSYVYTIIQSTKCEITLCLKKWTYINLNIPYC